jgi:hypothetical protein
MAEAVIIHMRAYYIMYCNILNRVIKHVKRQDYCRIITQSGNKIKAAWNMSTLKLKIGKLHLTERFHLFLQTVKK